MNNPVKIIQQDVLNLAKYSGNTKPRKSISASMLDDDMLKIYFRVKFGIIDNQTFTQDNTLGSIFQLGIDHLADERDTLEARVRREIPYKDSGWILSAETDIIDYENKTICDFKLTKEYTYKNFNQNHSYAWQVRLQDYIFRKTNLIKNDYKLYLYMLFKDIRQNESFLKPIEQIVEVEKYEDDVIEEKIDEIIYVIESWLEDESKIEVCKDLWWRKSKNGNSYPSKCEKYCSYKSICKFYNSHSKTPVMKNEGLGW